MSNYRLWAADDAAKERWRESRPTCNVCGEHIQDEYLYETIRGLLCEECAEAYADELAEDFKRDLMEDWRQGVERYVEQ